ncbi:ribosome biogenesis GTPase YlqF [Mangrovibacillus cuniculi]|uniref:Ribosome biogenesis GTPase A n=1 Tax=Mangrovibacillus cuniculi TaxID=2593652 RepID=A0A7S8HFB0_9BACI|nr:ribosome biogenesis GTPase YlqF [Mangrovibacillus cuniculi]QPC46326.1 ribosome biogenesis GTPase YlqF [Mangrovibacillus cuniculi]
MTIQWFPGHMAKARREVTEKLKLVDIIIELVDARLPMSSRNPMIDQITGEKPRLVVLNKADLADKHVTEQWIAYFKDRGVVAISINAQAGQGMREIVKACQVILKPKFDRLIAKGVKPRAIRAMILGIPNVGKSTLINRLAKKNIAKTGNMPGVTKAQQWIKVGKEMDLLDTPGILWPKFEDQEIGFKLALTGAIKDSILNLHEISQYALEILHAYYPVTVEERYGIEEWPEEVVELFNQIGEKRKIYREGGEIDYDKTAEMIVREVRSGTFGTISLDRPDEWEEKADDQ